MIDRSHTRYCFADSSLTDAPEHLRKKEKRRKERERIAAAPQSRHEMEITTCDRASPLQLRSLSQDKTRSVCARARARERERERVCYDPDRLEPL